jgi:FtsZ-binding cell division protein ZapB/regulator of replication initiation timing
MSYNDASNGGTESQYSQPKDNRKLIYGILIAALIGTWAYIFYDKSKTKETVTTLQTKIVNVDSARNAIQQEFLTVSAKADSLTQTNIQLQGDLADKSSAIQKLKGNIGNILKKKNASDAELAEAKQMIFELNGKVDGLFAELDKLKGENKQLTSANEQLNTEKTKLTADKQDLEQNLNTTKTEKKQLEEKVDVATTLHASNIGIAAIKVSSNGKEKETTTAKRANLIRIAFVLDENRVTPTGPKDIYVIVTGPDGKVITEGGTFNTREEGSKSFTSKVPVNYEQGKVTPVSFDCRQNDKYKEGDYKVEIYNNGFKIGQGVKTLKKGGLFS